MLLLPSLASQFFQQKFACTASEGQRDFNIITIPQACARLCDFPAAEYTDICEVFGKLCLAPEFEKGAGIALMELDVHGA